MLANFHTHTTFSDGKNPPEEVIQYAIENGFRALGFSDHAYTPHDLRYCMTDTQGYIAEITRLKKKYVDKIQIYLGIEEDATAPVHREVFDYRIGSLHYIYLDGKYYPLDSNYEYFTICAELFKGDNLAFAECYYEYFCRYLEKEKPDMIGHFDLVTKFDEKEQDRFLHNEKYWAIAERFLGYAIKTGCIFEVNTGLMSRGYRSSPCPHERLLRLIAKNNGKVALSSDAHKIENLCAYFEEMKKTLKTMGVDGVYILHDGTWQKHPI